MNSLKSMYIEITSKCNMNCPYCYNDSTCSGDYLSKNLFFDLINQGVENSLSEITISGGEPFLYKDIDELIKYANKNHIRARIITNLTIVNIDNAIEILRHGNFFQLTLDSTVEEENDKIRGKNTFKKTLELLERAKLLGLSKQIVLRMNLSKSNVNRIQSFINLAINYNIKHITIAFIANSGRGSDYKLAYNYNESLFEMIGIMEKLKSLSSQYKDIIDINYNNLEEQRSCPLFNNSDIEVNPRIDAKGNVFFCGYFFGDENILGNINNQKLLEIINSNQFYLFKQKVQSRKNNKKCETCIFNKLCCCGCPAVSYMNTNNIYDIDTQCKMIKYFMKNKIKEKIAMEIKDE